MATVSEGTDKDVSMASPASESQSASTFQPFTKADRIRQLNEIDKSIAQLLQSAGLAIKTLTAIQTDLKAFPPDTESQSTFTDATNIYLEAVHSVDVRLKRQIFGLIEAGIMGLEKESSKSSGQILEKAREARDKITLDVGWLNSRSGKVGRDMEAELWGKARAFLEDLEAKQGNHGNSQEEESDGENGDMED